MTTINSPKSKGSEGRDFIIETDPSEQPLFLVLTCSWPVLTIAFRPAAAHEILLRAMVMRLLFTPQMHQAILALALEVSDHLSRRILPTDGK